MSLCIDCIEESRQDKFIVIESARYTIHPDTQHMEPAMTIKESNKPTINVAKVFNSSTVRNHLVRKKEWEE